MTNKLFFFEIEMFKEKVEQNKRKALTQPTTEKSAPVAQSEKVRSSSNESGDQPMNRSKPSSKEIVPASFETEQPEIQPITRSKTPNESEIKNLKLDKIENELGITDLETTFTYYANLADNSNKTNTP